MNYNLEGELRMGGTVALDNTLTLSSAAAQAKAAGDAINAVKESIDEHAADTKNPHGVTKEQLGLYNVDNTSDESKPVSVAQAEAINKVSATLENKKVDKVAGKGLSSNDFTNEYKEKLDGIEANANKYVLQDGSVTKAKLGSDVTAAALGGAVPSVTAVATLESGKWTNKTQTVSVSGVTASNHLIITPAHGSYVMYGECFVRCTAQTSGGLTFQCEDVPTSNLTVNILIVG